MNLNVFAHILSQTNIIFGFPGLCNPTLTGTQSLVCSVVPAIKGLLLRVGSKLPCVIYLELIEQKLKHSNSKSISQFPENQKEKTRTILNIADEHFCSYSHFTDFKLLVNGNKIGQKQKVAN